MSLIDVGDIPTWVSVVIVAALAVLILFKISAPLLVLAEWLAQRKGDTERDR